VIVQECLDIACELEIGVLRHKGKLIFTKIGKIESKSGFYDYKEKYSGTSDVKIDSAPKIPERIEKELRGSAEKLASALEIRSISRIDFFLDKSGKLYFNEINTMPGFTGGSLYPALCREAGIAPRELVEALICEALL
jgi:D-alanine--D-alanine ligase